MEQLADRAAEVWQWLTAATPTPSAGMVLAALLLGVILVTHQATRHATELLNTIAHEGGHAAAAVLTGGRVTRVLLHADASGMTQHIGSGGGFRGAIVSFAGYPFPAIVGAGLIAASVSGSARLWSAATALALLLLLLRIRNLHGWVVVALATIAVGAALWYAPGHWLAAGLAAMGSVLLAGSLRSLIHERRGRQRGSTDSDVAMLARRGRLPAGFYWTAMLAVVAVSTWFAWSFVTNVYPLPW